MGAMKKKEADRPPFFMPYARKTRRGNILFGAAGIEAVEFHPLEVPGSPRVNVESEVDGRRQIVRGQLLKSGQYIAVFDRVGDGLGDGAAGIERESLVGERGDRPVPPLGDGPLMIGDQRVDQIGDRLRGVQVGQRGGGAVDRGGVGVLQTAAIELDDTGDHFRL